MKKVLSALLIVCFLFSLCGCKNQTGGSSYESYYEYFVEENSSDSANEEDSAPSNSNSQNSPAESNPDSNKESALSDGNQTVTNTNASVENITVDEEEIKEPETDKIKEEIKIETNHTPLSVSDYYQYSTLSATEKKVYSSIASAANSAKNVADISKYNMSYSDAYKVLQKFIADNPQFFYISKSFLFTTNADTGNVIAIILCYTDGSVIDTFDNSLNLIKSADRTLISQKIQKFNNAVEDALHKIPSNFSQLEKEKLIHDFIHNNVTYDYDSADKKFAHGETLPHAYDIYGAAVGGKAVCEGYSKFFQYLCYCVGLNATQISGTADGGNHMWNAVKIEGKWYHIDATWGDGSDYLSYTHFNLTTEQISTDHQIDSAYTAVPTCNSDESSAINTFIIYVDDLSKPPSNYKTATDIAAKLGDKSLFIYFQNPNMTEGMIDLNYYQKYIADYFFNATNEVSNYIYNKGIILNTYINGIGNMVYLTAN